MASEKKNLGGRPRLYENGSRNVTISLPVELAALLKELGGSHWIRDDNSRLHGVFLFSYP